MSFVTVFINQAGVTNMDTQRHILTSFKKKCDTPHMTKKTKTALIVVTYSITNTHEFVSMNVEHVYLL